MDMLATQKIIAELSELISFPSVSSNGNHKAGIHNCAAWLVKHLQSIGLQRAVAYKTVSHPVVYAEYIANPSFKTILFYGHYDVQPADPVDKWLTPPFKAVIKGDYIYGRGASDDKGQLFIHLKAAERLLKSGRPLPVNIKFLVEGAEEIGSVGLKDFITAHKRLLRCDTAVVSDTKMAALHVPAITYALRGSLNAEIFIQTSNKDLHSGTFAGYTPNAAITLSNFISTLFRKDNSVAIPGFYDDVDRLLQDERKFIQANSISDEKLLHDAEVYKSWGETNYSFHERATIRPSLSVTGITSGFQGTGVKNVIPSAASVKLNFRLVPHQHPERVRSLLDDYIRNTIPGAKIKTAYSSFNKPVTVARNNPYVTAAAKAYEQVFHHKVRYIQNGGTIGAVDHLHHILGVPIVLMGFAQATDNMHAPNEKFYLPNFFRGMDTVIQFIKNVSLLTHQTKSHAAAYH